MRTTCAAGFPTNITRTIKASFVDLESDSTAPAKPMFGIAGWTKGDEAVVLNDAFDLWRKMLVEVSGMNHLHVSHFLKGRKIALTQE